MAIFLLVVMATLAAWLTRMTTTVMSMDALELQGERAYLAAQAGIDAGLYALGPTYSAAGQAACTQTLTFTGQLADFSVQVSCESMSANEGGTTLYFTKITSTASNSSSGSCTPTMPDCAMRQITTTLEQ